MKYIYKLAFIFCLLFTESLAYAYDYDLHSIRNIGLPVIEITTVDGEMPTCEYITHPEGAMGMSITNATKVPGRLCITLLGDTLYDSGEYIKDEGGMTIKINGNTSAYYNNKPYKIKLQKKADLLLREDSKYKDKEWRLLKDACSLNTMVGLKVNELIGMQWTPRYSYCNVMLNNQYQGCYILIETVKRNPDCRIDISKEGYIIERDAYWWNEDVYFKSNFFNDGRYGWTFKEPDNDAITQEQIDYIQQVVDDAEASIVNGTYNNKIDTHSFACWLLAHDILGTWDTGGSNIYITKYDNTEDSKLMMGNLWDFDTIFRVDAEEWNKFHKNNEDFYFEQLLTSYNRSFTSEYKTIWNSLQSILYDEIETMLTEFKNSNTATSLQLSRQYYDGYYDYGCTSIDEEVSDILNWFERRIPWLNTEIAKMDDETSIANTCEKTSNSYIYNLCGQRILNPSGIYIKDGKKYFYDGRSK